VKVVDFTGGEPTLFKHLVPALALAKSLGFMTSVTTNGMIYPRFADAMAGKVDALLFSIDSPDRDEHDRIRGVKSFDLAVRAVRLAKKKGEVVYISSVVTNESIDRVEEMVRFARELGAILYLGPCYSYFGNPGLTHDNCRRLLGFYGRPGLIVDRAELRLIIDGGNDIADPVCRAVSSTVVISPDNKLLLPCYHLSTQGLPITDDLFEVYHSSIANEAKAMEGRYDFCAGCAVYCYMRMSLYRKYPLDSLRSAAHYLKERVRYRRAPVLALAAEPAEPPKPLEPGAGRRRLPLMKPPR
jgi:MoaA/NifB/PqqE/SkfB family radical SAM enzyme